MKISTEIHSAAKHIGEHRAVELIAKAGFDAWDFSMFNMARYDGTFGRYIDNNPNYFGNEHIKFARELRHIGEEMGICCNQSHAPFPTDPAEMKYFIKKAIECTAEAGGEICIIHPKCSASPEENAEMYLELLPFAKVHNVKIATENMFLWDREQNHSVHAACGTPESFCKHIDLVNDPYFVACLDVGHAEMLGSETTAEEMVRELSHRLKALHLHDNDKLRDLHTIPFSMRIDFEAIVKALKDIGYDGYFTLESDSYLKTFTPDNIFEGIKDLAAAAKRLAEMY